MWNHTTAFGPTFASVLKSTIQGAESVGHALVHVWWNCMSVNAMNRLNYKCQSVNQASFLEREPTKVFLHGCHTLVYVPLLVNVHLYSGRLRVS